MPSFNNEFRIKRWEIFGGKRAFFIRYADVINSVIDEFKLTPIKEQILNAKRLTPEMQKSESIQMMMYMDPDSHGGKRFAHLHYRGEIFRLNNEQWLLFTARIQKDFITRLEAASAISVEQIQDLNDAIDPIA